MKIVDLKCAIIGKSPIVRIVTDEGISGYAQAETWKPYLKPHILAFRDALIGEDPTLVEPVMLKIRQRGGFKPWGTAVRVIEMALWDLAGKAAGVPVHKLLGGKIRDRVRVYDGSVRFPFTGHRPEDYGDDMKKMMALIAGPALTLQMMPKREDLYGSNEYDNPERQLHRHVLYPAQAGDMVVVDARGDMASGIFGEMMLTYLAGRGGTGIVVDGCIRDSAKAAELDLGIWVKGVTPNYHAQTNLIPFAVNVPVACGGALVMPGDIIVADDDGVVVVPVALAEKLIEEASKHAEWEEFARLRLSQGADLRKYYPLTAEVEPEYQAWRAANPLQP